MHDYVGVKGKYMRREDENYRVEELQGVRIFGVSEEQFTCKCASVLVTHFSGTSTAATE